MVHQMYFEQFRLLYNEFNIVRSGYKDPWGLLYLFTPLDSDNFLMKVRTFSAAPNLSGTP